MMRARPAGPVRWTAFAVLAAIPAALAATLAALGALGALAATFAAFAGAGLVLALGGWRMARVRQAKLSADITALSERLLRLEDRAREALARPGPAADGATAGMAADLELLGRLVGDVAQAVSDQSREIAALKANAGLPSPAGKMLPGNVAADAEAARAVPGDAPPAVCRLTSRDDFARAAGAIMRRLGAGVPDPVPGAGLEAALLRALDEERLELHLQAVVTLPQRRTRFYEASGRLRTSEGVLVAPQEFLPVLERHSLLSRLDGLALGQTFAVARHLSARDSGAAVALSLAPSSLAEPTFLDGVETLLRGDPGAAARLIFAIGDAASLGAAQAAGMARLRAAGAVLAADSPPSLDADWPALARRGVRFIRADADTLLLPRHRASLAGIVHAVSRAGMELVATGVDEESRVPELLDYDMPLAQGAAIAPARPVRAEVLGRGAATSADTPPPTRPELPAGAVPFREFLRRVG